METLNLYYAQLLQVGFIVLRQAVWSDNQEWARMEVQHLHNIPSLINESNVERHRYFWDQERQMYLEWVNRVGDEPRSRMLTYYAPIWSEMEPAMQEFLASPVCRS
ncbi:MAG TPA: hypothetical protein VGI40_18525 [Pirellulaceae bacterium]|jgi:hypothetical protein